MVYLAKRARSQVEPKLNKLGVKGTPAKPAKVPANTDPNRYEVIRRPDKNLCYDKVNREYVNLITCLESGTPSALEGSTLSSRGYGSLS